ncbi:hypothetical protein T439DRAFT_363651 [Meredithblackwellia eburnea MCA 4105]
MMSMHQSIQAQHELEFQQRQLKEQEETARLQKAVAEAAVRLRTQIVSDCKIAIENLEKKGEIKRAAIRDAEATFKSNMDREHRKLYEMPEGCWWCPSGPAGPRLSKCTGKFHGNQPLCPPCKSRKDAYKATKNEAVNSASRELQDLGKKKNALCLLIQALSQRPPPSLANCPFHKSKQCQGLLKRINAQLLVNPEKVAVTRELSCASTVQREKGERERTNTRIDRTKNC